jgi:hypothetical protein
VESNLEARGHDREVDAAASALKKREDDVTGARLRDRDMMSGKETVWASDG